MKIVFKTTPIVPESLKGIASEKPVKFRTKRNAQAEASFTAVTEAYQHKGRYGR